MNIKLLSLSKNQDFKSLLTGKKISNKFVNIFFKNLSNKSNNYLNISFVTQKKLGNAVKRNKIKRRLKYAVQKISEENELIDLNYTYVIFGKNNVYKDKFTYVLNETNATFKKIKQMDRYSWN